MEEICNRCIARAVFPETGLIACSDIDHFIHSSQYMPPIAAPQVERTCQRYVTHSISAPHVSCEVKHEHRGYPIHNVLPPPTSKTALIGHTSTTHGPYQVEHGYQGYAIQNVSLSPTPYTAVTNHAPTLHMYGHGKHGCQGYLAHTILPPSSPLSHIHRVVTHPVSSIPCRAWWSRLWHTEFPSLSNNPLRSHRYSARIYSASV